MITKAIIKQKLENKYLVRIPLLESSATIGEVVLYATLCYEPGNLDTYNIDDVVFVDFENNQLNKPVIIGKLYLEEEEKQRGYVKTGSINVNTSAYLPFNTYIGDVTPDEVYAALKNDKINQDRLAYLEDKVKELEERLENN